MEFKFKSGCRVVREILYVTHKAKGPNYSIGTHQHSAHEIIYVDYGKVLLAINGMDLLLKPGNCIFISGETPHLFSNVAGAPFDFFNICYRGVLPETISGCPIPVSSEVREIFEHIKKETQDDKLYCREIVACLLTEIIYQLRRQCEMPRKAPLPPGGRNNERYRSEAVQRALAVIQAEYAKKLSCHEVSIAAGVSPSYLRALLSRETGENFSHHLQKARISAARKMLLETSYSIGDIAERCGYLSLPFFFNIFKKFTGMTPAGYARSLGDPEDKR